MSDPKDSKIEEEWEVLIERTDSLKAFYETQSKDPNYKGSTTEEFVNHVANEINKDEIQLKLRE